MRARMGFVQAFLYGTGAFTVITAAFCVALSIAIGGPPTQSEANGLQAVAGDAASNLQHAARRAGAGVCRRIPDLVRIGACAAPEVRETSYTPPHHPALPAHVAPAAIEAPLIVPVADVAPPPSIDPDAEPALRTPPAVHVRPLRPQRRITLAGGRRPHPAAHVERMEVGAHDTVTHRTPHLAHALATRQLAATHHARPNAHVGEIDISDHRPPPHVTHAQHVQLQHEPHAPVAIQAATHVAASPHVSAAPAHVLHAALPVGQELAAATPAHEEGASNTEAAAPAMARGATAEAARERNPAQALQDNGAGASDPGSGAAASGADKP